MTHIFFVFVVWRKWEHEFRARWKAWRYERRMKRNGE